MRVYHICYWVMAVPLIVWNVRKFISCIQMLLCCFYFKQKSLPTRKLLASIIFGCNFFWTGILAFWFRHSYTNAISALMAKTSSSGDRPAGQDRRLHCPVGWLAGCWSTESRRAAEFSSFVHSASSRRCSVFCTENRQLLADGTTDRHVSRCGSVFRCSCWNKGKIHVQG